MVVLTKNLTETKIQNSFKKFLESLSEKEKIVISKRVWLNWEVYTLQSIGDSFNPNITRERVRQLEATWIKKLGRIIKTSNLFSIQEFSREKLIEAGGLLTKDKLLSTIIRESGVDTEMSSTLISIIIQADYNILKSKPRISTKTYFFMPDIKKELVEEVHKEWVKILRKKWDVMEQRSLYELIKIKLWDSKWTLTLPLIDNIFDIYCDVVKWEEKYIGLSKWRILNPKTLKDKIIYVMKKEKVPLHFVDISNKVLDHLGDRVKVNTVHNELIRNNDFVLIWKWIYVLKEWGFKSGTVIDVIIDVMEKAWEPMKTEEIITKVLKTRIVKESTIYMNLQNKKYIKRVWRNFYELKK